MRTLFRLTLIVVLLMMASSVLAVDFPCADNETNCSGYVPDSDIGDGGYGSSNYKSPTTDTCSARQSRGQACRACIATIQDNGQWTGYAVCGYVTWTAGCYCTGNGTDACQAKGSCTYYFN
jgi:hypothetical protein